MDKGDCCLSITSPCTYTKSASPRRRARRGAIYRTCVSFTHLTHPRHRVSDGGGGGSKDSRRRTRAKCNVLSMAFISEYTDLVVGRSG